MRIEALAEKHQVNFLQAYQFSKHRLQRVKNNNELLRVENFMLDCVKTHQDLFKAKLRKNKEIIISSEQKIHILRCQPLKRRGLVLNWRKMSVKGRKAKIHKAIEDFELRIKSSKLCDVEIDILRTAFQEKHEQFLQEVANTREKLYKGLLPARIKVFTQFKADKSHVSDQCSICMEYFEIGRNMMRLDCDGKHVFCQVCIEGWFADHKTCPLCRHVF